ncbi:MAG: Carbohydrate binding domain (family 25) [Firmicutes bacterium]|nr:Carbohydrate binding domain (family 25) [Bacillota bacterium]
MTEIEYVNNGVTISPAIPSPYDDVELSYSGLLIQSGATEVYAHIGFGDTWANSSEYKLEKSGHQYKTKIYIPSNAENLNVCFKDAADNWDNNSGTNYSFVLSVGERKDYMLSNTFERL